MSGRIRSIKPEWLEDERLVLLKPGARTLSVSLLVLADDQGRGRFIPVVMASRIFPGDPGIFPGSFCDLASVGFVRVYEVDGQRYWEIRNWNKHQRVDKPAKPRLPEPLACHYIESQDFFLGIPGIPRLTPIPIPTRTPTSTTDPDQDPFTFVPSKISEAAHREVESRPKAKRPKALPAADASGLVELTDLWFHEFEKYYAQKPAWNGVQASKLKQLIAQSDVEELRVLIPAFFAWKRPEVIKAGHSLWKGFASMTAKLDELRADLANPDRRAFAAEFASHEQQANHEAQGAAQTKRIVAAATGNQDAHAPFRITPAPSDQTVGLDPPSGGRPQPEDVRRSDHRLVQGPSSVRSRIGDLARNGGGVRRGTHAEPSPHEGADEGEAGNEPIYGPGPDDGGRTEEG